jgi:hypothetical protein
MKITRGLHYHRHERRLNHGYRTYTSALLLGKYYSGLVEVKLDSELLPIDIDLLGHARHWIVITTSSQSPVRYRKKQTPSRDVSPRHAP